MSSSELLGLPVSYLLSGEKKGLQKEVTKLIKSGDLEPGTTKELQGYLFKGTERSKHACQVLLTSFELEEERFHILIINLQSQGNGSVISPAVSQRFLNLVAELNRNRKRISSFIEILDDATPELMERKPELVKEFKSIDSALSKLENSLVNTNDQSEFRLKLVELMNASLDCWGKSTGLLKIDLALQSNLWKVYTDYNGYQRTQTFDKYLEVATLPKKPKVNLIFQTASFVLANAKGGSPQKAKLESALAQVQEMV